MQKGFEKGRGMSSETHIVRKRKVEGCFVGERERAQKGWLHFTKLDFVREVFFSVGFLIRPLFFFSFFGLLER